MQRNSSSSGLHMQELIREQLLYEIRKGLPSEMDLISYNFSRTNMSMYSLLCKENNRADLKWLTLRTADHPVWLENAEQLSIDFGNPADLNQLSTRIKNLFMDSTSENYYYKISVIDTAILQLLDKCQQYGVVWTVRLPEEISSGHKEIPLDLNKEFMEADLFLGSRNNLNSLLLPIHSKKFQFQLAKLFGRNLLFSQFAKRDFLKLLPTNQWLQPIIEKEKSVDDWKKIIKKEYGQHLIDTCEEAIKQKLSNKK